LLLLLLQHEAAETVREAHQLRAKLEAEERTKARDARRARVQARAVAATSQRSWFGAVKGVVDIPKLKSVAGVRRWS
jgi:hypothetical protein